MKKRALTQQSLEATIRELTATQEQEARELQQKITQESEAEVQKQEYLNRAYALSQQQHDSAFYQSAFQLLQTVTPLVCGLAYQVDPDKKQVKGVGAFAVEKGDADLPDYEFGAGLAGHVAKTRAAFYIDHLPEDGESEMEFEPTLPTAHSGLGNTTVKYLLGLPMVNNSKINGVLELGTFEPISKPERQFLQQLANALAGQTPNDG